MTSYDTENFTVLTKLEFSAFLWFVFFYLRNFFIFEVMKFCLFFFLGVALHSYSLNSSEISFGSLFFPY